MSQDYRINAQVRALFVRQNVDLAKVQHGTTNGVIYVRGRLHSFIYEGSSDLANSRLTEAVLTHRIEKALRRLPGVRDVVFQLDRVVKVGIKWKPR